jgi:hypothetical protein
LIFSLCIDSCFVNLDLDAICSFITWLYRDHYPSFVQFMATLTFKKLIGFAFFRVLGSHKTENLV